MKKVIVTVFYFACGIIFIDYLENDKKIKGEYYVNLMDRFNHVMNKSPHLVKKGILFHQCNASEQLVIDSAVRTKFYNYNLLVYNPHQE